MVKKYKASTGVDEFYYGALDETEVAIITGSPERIEFLQTLNIEMPQEPVRAYGDNKTAEIAVSNGNVTVTAAFHRLPEEDKAVLFGLEKTETGLYSYGSTDTPPYVACIFAKTYQDGSKEWVGLPKGLFMRPTINSQTKADGVEFSTEETSAEFMDREVSGFTEEKSVVFGRDEKGSTAQRDALFQAIFGKAYPSTATTTTTTTV
ncbi:major tail protein [Metabacillus bambusae]|uniref:Phage tail protein n=1 Tax=Metabacillus bambusae TaxID=2795218 RepID=A0ABS3N4M3_9BACI|nr:major tail protein [Metabacillus bambusae]MBO1513261.1 phage tail protein [Metabacillus bambusae]